MNVGMTWAAEIKSYKAPNHLVVVEGINETGHLIIRDPARNRPVTVSIEDFLWFWTERAVYR
jgi:hypothetical protein